MKDINRGFEVEVYRRASPSHRTVPLPQRGKNCSLLFASRGFIGLQMGEDHMKFRCDMSAVIVDALSKGSELLHFKAQMEDLWPLLSRAEKQMLVKNQPRSSPLLHEDAEAADRHMPLGQSNLY